MPSADVRVAVQLQLSRADACSGKQIALRQRDAQRLGVLHRLQEHHPVPVGCGAGAGCGVGVGVGTGTSPNAAL